MLDILKNYSFFLNRKIMIILIFILSENTGNQIVKKIIK